MEIDKDVVELARDYFYFDPGTEDSIVGKTFVEDGYQFLTRECDLRQNQVAGRRSYNFVIHDVWNGDFVVDQTLGESSSLALYMLEAFKKISCLLSNNDSVFVMNYYGLYDSMDFRAVIKTLKMVFPTMRIFHDGNYKKSSSSAPYNLVVFAKRSGSLRFRGLQEADLLESSTIRYDALTEMQRREIDLDMLQNLDNIPYILENANNGTKLLWEFQQNVRKHHNEALEDIRSDIISEDSDVDVEL